jgi:Lon protease-like protein
MSPTAIELPLFPLDCVLFPGAVRPLHIFETRYCQMVKDCLQEGKSFGIVLAKEDSQYLYEEPHTIGTMAEIHNLDRQADGCYNLMAVGTMRFRIIDCHREKSYLSGFVEPFKDRLESREKLAGYAQRARDLFITYLKMVLEKSEEGQIEISVPSDPEGLSHFIAYFLDMDDEKKLKYLELTSTSQRLQEEIAFLCREVPFMRHMLFKEPPRERIQLN